MTRFAQPPAITAPEARGGDETQSDEATRVRLAACPESAPDLLATLAADTALTVRAAVALNTAATAGADRILAGDRDERVRALLARKLSNLLPSLQTAERDRLQMHALQVLAELVEDEAVRVRATIAEVVKEMPQAPRDLILRLAHDSAVPVSEPVIRLSPLLTTEDLLTLLLDAPHAATASAVAGRAGLNETLSDAIAAGADTAAIAALLENRSAAIREATLDRLIAIAAERTDWHAPLVRRPHLTAAAACALSDIVATHLLDELASRADLPRALAAELKRQLQGRLQRARPTGPSFVPNMDEAMAEAWALAENVALDEATLLATVRRGEVRMATALLAVAAKVPAAVVERAATLRSGKALVSLVWRAGFSMQVAGPLQTLLARTPPAYVLRGGPDGIFPLAVQEMRWQIEFLMRTGR